MQKKVFLIILLLASLVFYGCSSMKHSTIVLYVSHKVEGPLYMPEREPPVSTQAPQVVSQTNQRANSVQANQVQEQKPTRGQANQNQQNSEPAKTSAEKNPASASKTTQDSQPNQSSKPAQASQENSKPVSGGSKTAQGNQANQSSEPVKTSAENNTTRGSKTTQENQNNQPAKTSQESSKPTRGNQSSTPQKQESQESKISRESQSTPRNTSRESKDNQNQNITNTYGNYTTRILPRGEFLVLENPIRFAFEKYYIASSYDDTVQYVADFMKLNTNFLLVVEGHTDRVGEYRFNKTLSLRRSRATISKLVQAGVAKNRLIESGVSYRFSEYNFNRLNRRVEFIIIRSPEDITNYREGIK